MTEIRRGSADTQCLELKARLVASKPASLDKNTLSNDYVRLYDQLVSTHSSGSPDDSWIILLNDTLAVCLLRMTQLCNRSNVKWSVPSENIRAILNYIVHYSNHTSNPLISSLTSLLNKLMMFNSANDDSQGQIRIQEVLSSVLSSHRSLTKNLYNLVDVLIKNLDNKYFVLESFPSFPEQCVESIGDDHLANSVSKTLVTLFVGILGSKSSDQWFSTWAPAVKYGLSDSQIRANMLTYLVPNLVKVRPDTLPLLVSQFSGDRLEDLSDEDLDILFNLYKIGQELSLSHQLPESLLKTFLIHSNPQFRLNSLSLLLGGSSKTTKSVPIPPHVYVTVKETQCLDTFLNDYEDIETRNKFISLMSHFIGFRFKESMYSLKKELAKLAKKNINEARQKEIASLVESGLEFLEWLVGYLVGLLNPGSNYSQLITSIKLLEVINSKLEGDEYSIYRDERTVHFLIQNLFNNYENIRQLSLDLLITNSSPKLPEFIDSKLESELFPQSCDILSSLTGRKSDGAAKFFEFLTIYYLNVAKDPAKVLSLIDTMTGLVSRGIDKVKSESLANFRNYNSDIYVHGYFKALTSIFEKLDSSSLVESNQGYFSSTYSTIIGQVFDIWELVKPVLSNSSASGEEDDDEINEDDDKILLNYSWKVIKDSNILLHKLLTSHQPGHYIDIPTFLQCCSLISNQLSSVKHRGAFSSIYPSFISICRILNHTENLKGYPRKWLDDNLKLLESKSQYISRRSGGIPFLITGILIAAEPESKNPTTSRESLMQVAFEQLFRIANQPSTHLADQKDDIPPVHAFNCIKQIFNESALAKESLVYVESSLGLSLENFQSANWSVRNCAVMLFGTIQRRIFGTRNAASYPSKLFFQKFPEIDQILSKQLADAHHRNHDNFENNQIMFPILIILLSLDTSLAQDDKVLIKFKTNLLKFLNNKFWKIREMVAKCVASTFSAQELFEFTKDFFKSETWNKKTELNSIQSTLMIMHQGYPKIQEICPQDAQELSQLISDNLLRALAFKSPYIVKAYVDALEASSPDSIISPKHSSILGNYFIEMVLEDSNKLDGGKQVLLSRINRLILNSYLKHYACEEVREESIVDLIRLGLGCFDMFKVQLANIDFILDNFEWFKTLNQGVLASLAQDIWALILERACFDYVKSRAMELFSRVLELRTVDLVVDEVIDKLKQFLLVDEENLQLNSLKCLGAFASRLSSESQVDFLKQCDTIGNEANSVKHRFASIKALIHGLSSYDTHNQSVEKSKMEMRLVFRGLYDDDERIRLLTAEFLSSYLGMDATINPHCLARLSIDKLKKTSSHFEEAVIEWFLESRSGVELAELNASQGEILFDVENVNLYANQIDIARNLKRALSTIKNFGDLNTKITNAIGELLQALPKLGQDGILGWSRDPRLYNLVVVTILDAQTVLELNDDAMLKRAYSDLKNTLQQAHIDLSVSQFIEALLI